ncbi:MAG: hypothetical protein WD872_08630 [Pirellulaceae bacterium]
MPPDKDLLDAIYRDKIRQARQMTGEERVLAMFELTSAALRINADGVRNQFPQASNEEVRGIVCERIARLRRMHERR